MLPITTSQQTVNVMMDGDDNDNDDVLTWEMNDDSCRTIELRGDF